MSNINLEDLKIYKSPYEKIRLGKNFDGGYVICKMDCRIPSFLVVSLMITLLRCLC